MKKYILRVINYFTVLLVLLSPLLFLKIGGESLKYIDNPTALIIDKTKRLENLNTPKIIIIGGSSAFFGMDSEVLEKELSKPVVNMAQFAGFGLKFILNQVENNINPEDIIFICSEYYLNVEISDRAKNEIIKYYPKASLKYFEEDKLSYLDIIINNFSNNIESLLNFILIPISRKSPIYKHSRQANIYGDNIGYINYPNPTYRDTMKSLSYSYYDGIDYLSKFINQTTNKGGKVYIYFPPIPKSGYLLNKEVLDLYYIDYINNFGDIVLCTPKDMVFDDNMFFDTYYHLNPASRKERSKRIVKFYREYISKTQ